LFERFTERARRAVVLAQDEARTLEHNYIGTEHILLGLLREEEGLAARALHALEVTIEQVRADLERIIGRGTEVTPGEIPLTPRAKRVLGHAVGEADALGHGFVGTEHVLLGLLREEDGVAAQILRDSGAPVETVRDRLLAMLAGSVA
jgi:ATP-dependent Clp protease ATP-binding subunit ClpC